MQLNRLITLIFYFAFCIKANSQSPFIKSAGTANSDFGTSVTLLNDNSYALTIEISLNAPQNDSVSGTLIKTDCTGEVEWSRNYVIDQVNVATDVIQTTDNALMTEVISFEPGGANPHVSIIKTDVTGNILWCKKMSLSGLQENKLFEDAQGNIYLLANTKLIQGSYDQMGLLKFSPDGTLQWAKEYSFTYGCTPINLVRLANGNFVLVGRMTIPGNFFTDVVLTLVDGSGQQLKTVVAGTYYDDEPMDVITDDAGNINVCGRTYFLSRNWDAFHFVFNQNLEILGRNFYDANTSEGEVFRQCITDNGKILFAGDEGTFNERNLLVVKSDAAGNADWSMHYTVATLYTNYLFGICKNNSGGYILTGDVETIRLRDALVMQIDSIGSAGCLTSPFILDVYHDTLTLVDTLLFETQLSIVPVDTIPFEAPDPITTITRCGNQVMCIAFESEQDSVCPNPCIQLTDLSTGNTTTRWEIYHDNYVESSTDQNPIACFENEGDYLVNLIIGNGQDSLVKSEVIHVEKDCPVFVPNIFTPNNDHVNDEFRIRDLPEQFNLHVFNRWGSLVFKTSEPQDFWNGENENGKLVSSGTYYYILELIAEQKVMKGWVEVVY